MTHSTTHATASRSGRSSARIGGVVLAGLAALGLFLPSAAAEAERIDVSVSYMGERVEFSVPVGALETEPMMDKLYQALERRADAACRRTIPGRIGRSIPVDRCMARLMDGFVEDIGHEGLSARHAAQTA
ncbi:MAG: UrcA family protein [Litorimonas sp.]